MAETLRSGRKLGFIVMQNQYLISETIVRWKVKDFKVSFGSPFFHLSLDTAQKNNSHINPCHLGGNLKTNLRIVLIYLPAVLFSS